MFPEKSNRLLATGLLRSFWPEVRPVFQRACAAGRVSLRQVPTQLLLGVALLATPALAQLSSSAFAGVPTKVTYCNSGESTASPAQLTFAQRACWYATDLTSTGILFRAGLSSAIGQWRDDNYGKGQDGTDYAHRFGVFYARRTGRDAAELFAGYLTHEDPRPRLSGETGIWRRTGFALKSVLIAKTDEGSHPAVTPIAGAFGSALVASEFSKAHDMTGGLILRHAAFSYSGSFGTAIYDEFKPDLTLLLRRALHRRTE